MDKRFGLILVAGLGGGCRESTCERAADVAAPTLDLGIGEGGFERALASGDVVQPAYGSQGGQHLWLAVRTTGISPGVPQFLASDKDVPVFAFQLVGLDDGLTYAEQEFRWQAMQGDEAAAELALGEFFLPEGGYYYDTDAGDGLPDVFTLHGRVEDICGTVLENEVQITIAW